MMNMTLNWLLDSQNKHLVLKQLLMSLAVPQFESSTLEPSLLECEILKAANDAALCEVGVHEFCLHTFSSRNRR